MPRLPSFSLIAGAVFALYCQPHISSAAPPTLDALHPPGIQLGTTAQVVAVGKADPWPADIHCSNPHITFKPDPKKKGTYSVTAAKEAETGPCLVHVYNKEGASKPMIFTVGKLAEIIETLDDKGNENNNSNDKAQEIKKLPTTLNGRLSKSDDVDMYRISLKKGQTLVASLEGYGLRSPMDPYLHLYDSEGTQLALGNDNGINLDPLLVYKANRDGHYTVAVMAYIHPPSSDIRFTGKTSTVYRLTLTTGPWLTHALPLSVAKTGDTALKLFGYNLPDGQPHLAMNYTNQQADAAHVTIRHPAFPNQLMLPVTDTAPSLLNKDSEITIPAAVTGQLSKAAEADQYNITVKKGQKLDIQVSSRSFGFPLDPVLEIKDAKGKQLKRVDDGNVKTDRDAKVTWSVPADGKYTLAVSDLFRKGGPRWHYLLTVIESKPHFTATADKSSYLLDGGKTVDLKCKVTRLNGHKSPLKLEAGNLPPGVSMEPPKEIPNKTADITVKLKAEETAPDAKLPLQITLRESSGDSPLTQALVFSFRPVIPGGPYQINETGDLWLTVKAKPKPKPKPEAKPEAKKEDAKPKPDPKKNTKPGPKKDKKQDPNKKPEEKKAAAEKKLKEAAANNQRGGTKITRSSSN